MVRKFTRCTVLHFLARCALRNLLLQVSDLESETRQLKKVVEERDLEIARLQAEMAAQKKASDAEVGLGWCSPAWCTGQHTYYTLPCMMSRGNL